MTGREAPEPSILGTVPTVTSLTRGRTEQSDPHRTQRTLWHLGKKQTLTWQIKSQKLKVYCKWIFFFLKISIFSIYCHRDESQHQLGVKDDRWPSPRAQLAVRSFQPGSSLIGFLLCVITARFFVLSDQLRFCVNRFT